MFWFFLAKWRMSCTRLRGWTAGEEISHWLTLACWRCSWAVGTWGLSPAWALLSAGQGTGVSWKISKPLPFTLRRICVVADWQWSDAKIPFLISLVLTAVDPDSGSCVRVLLLRADRSVRGDSQRKCPCQPLWHLSCHRGSHGQRWVTHISLFPGKWPLPMFVLDEARCDLRCQVTDRGKAANKQTGRSWKSQRHFLVYAMGFVTYFKFKLGLRNF